MRASASPFPGDEGGRIWNGSLAARFSLRRTILFPVRPGMYVYALLVLEKHTSFGNASNQTTTSLLVDPTSSLSVSILLGFDLLPLGPTAFWALLLAP
jgi:hypothetical protein